MLDGCDMLKVLKIQPAVSEQMLRSFEVKKKTTPNKTIEQGGYYATPPNLSCRSVGCHDDVTHFVFGIGSQLTGEKSCMLNLSTHGYTNRSSEMNGVDG